MPREPVAIRDVGMAASLGMDAANACAAARAGITRPSKLKSMNFGGLSQFGRETMDGVPTLIGHPSAVGPGFTGKARLALLGSTALADLLHRAGLQPSDLARCSFHLNLSDRFVEQAYQASLEANEVPAQFPYPSDAWRNEANHVVELIFKRVGFVIRNAKRYLYFGGHAGFAVAAEQALADIQSGQYEKSIVGAIDCCLDPGYLEAAASLRVLKTEDNPVGSSPGEAAAFLLLESPGLTQAKRHPCPKLVAIALAEDVAHQFTERPPVGGGIEAAIRGVLGQTSSAAPSAFLVADLNGTERRAVDWGHAVVRMKPELPIGDLSLWLPAASFGETGAAAGAVAACVAVRAFERRYAPAPYALICLASESNARGCLLLREAA